MYLPAERMIMYMAPISITAPSLNTLSSSSAPLSTKKSAYSGAVHLSALSMRSEARGHMLQKTVPSIMQTSSDENETRTGPISNESMDSATVSTTKAIVSERRFELEKNVFSS